MTCRSHASFQESIDALHNATANERETSTKHHSTCRSHAGLQERLNRLHNETANEREKDSDTSIVALVVLMQVSKRGWIHPATQQPTGEKRLSPKHPALAVLMQVSKRAWINPEMQWPTREKMTLRQASCTCRSHACSQWIHPKCNSQWERERIEMIV